MSFKDIFKSSFPENVTAVSLPDMALALVLSFCLGLFIFFVYKKTYAGVMFSQAFGGSLIAMPGDSGGFSPPDGQSGSFNPQDFQGGSFSPPDGQGGFPGGGSSAAETSRQWLYAGLCVALLAGGGRVRMEVPRPQPVGTDPGQRFSQAPPLLFWRPARRTAFPRPSGFGKSLADQRRLWYYLLKCFPSQISF